MELLNRVWLGDAGLGKTYWLFGQVAGALLFVMFVSLAISIPGSTSAVVLSALYVCYLIWASTGIWRAAGKYEGPSVWSGFAKVYAVFGYFAAAALIVGALVAAISPKQDAPTSTELKPFTGQLDQETKKAPCTDIDAFLELCKK